MAISHLRGNLINLMVEILREQMSMLDFVKRVPQGDSDSDVSHHMII